MLDALYRFLATVGLQAPPHPLLVGVPAGLVFGALVFFVVGLAFKRAQFLATARHASILALVMLVPAILFGVFDWIHYFQGAVIPAIRAKMILSAILLVLLGAGIIVGSEERPRSAALAIVYACSFIAAAAVALYGAGLVYGKGPVVAEAPRIGVAEGRTEPAGEAKDLDGKALFEANCAGCHAGGGNSIVASLPIKGSGKMAGFEGFERFVRAPAMPDGKPGDMPPFGEDALEEAQAKVLYAYMKAEFR